MKKLRGIYRLLLMALSASCTILYLLLLRVWQGEDVRRNMRIRQRWLHWLLPHIGVRTHIEGTPPDFPCLMMCNHRSYLDPVILVKHTLAFPVSKAEVASWPIIGYGAALTGVLFLKRENQDSRKRTLQGIAEKVKAGYPVLLFPEGTSGAQALTLPFRLGGFDLAASADIPIVPVAVKYGTPLDYWVGDDTFIRHFLERFGERQMQVEIHFGPPVPAGTGPQMLAATQSWIDAALQRIRVNSPALARKSEGVF